MTVPKDPAANLQWRADLLTAAENDVDFQTDLYTACSQSVLFFVNAFAFTLRIHEVDRQGGAKQAEHSHLPFVTWPIQDRHILRIEHAIDEGESLLTDKSRDMGASWNHIIVYVHRFLFRPDEKHLMLSRKEDLVDMLDGQPKNYPHGSLSDPDTLFGKIDYVLSRLPEWMLPKDMNRKKMHLVNNDNGTRIDGESTNAFAGSGGRRTSLLLDEMAKMKEGASVKQSTKAVSVCRLVNSTPHGAGTAYSKWRMSGQIPVFTMGWWDHPEKGFSRYVKQDKLGRWQIRSPWYDRECEEATPKEVATELDMDHVGSGDTFFESTVIELHRKMHARPSKYRTGLTINFRKGTADDAIPGLIQKWNLEYVHATPSGPWKLWTILRNTGQKGMGRPDQTKTYTIACDIGKGMGASNSTISILCNETREKIAAFADPNVPPHAFAKIAVAACLWCGGRTKPLLIWENNGDPGFDFGNQVTQTFQYPNVYFDRQAGTTREKVGKRWGWRSSPEKKAIALGMLRRAYSHRGIINRDEAALDEALTYVHYENGGIGPAALVEEPGAARMAHGDRVIADMLCIVGVRGMPKFRRTEGILPRRSFGSRMQTWKRAQKSAQQRRTFNFSGVGS